MAPLLAIRDLRIAFPGEGGGWVEVVRGVSLDVASGEVVGLVGESGAGKSLTALAVLGLLPPPGRVVGGAIELDGVDLLGLREPELRRLRGTEIGLVAQEPAAALHPMLTVGRQLTETIRTHRGGSAAEARRLAAECLDRLALAEPAQLLDRYPHQISGGQRQRVALALALAGEPRLLIADEPTAALDPTLQHEVVDALIEQVRASGSSVLWISHDLPLVAEICDRAAVIYAGEVIEQGPVGGLFRDAAHPYTRGLLAASPSFDATSVGALPEAIPGQPPDASQRLPGCVFEPRCRERFDGCDREIPAWVEVAPGHGAKCRARAAELVRSR